MRPLDSKVKAGGWELSSELAVVVKFDNTTVSTPSVTDSEPLDMVKVLSG